MRQMFFKSPRYMAISILFVVCLVPPMMPDALADDTSAKAARAAAISAAAAAKSAGEAAKAAKDAVIEIRKLTKAVEELVRQNKASGAQSRLQKKSRRSRKSKEPRKPRTFRVGPNEKYKLPSQVDHLARDGDTVEIAAGVYEGDVARWRTNNLTLRGVGGRAHFKAMGRSSGGKAIWVIKGNNVVVENIEFSGARVRHLNGAGIRFNGAGLTIRNSYFHDNQMGILIGRNPNSDIVIEGSEFSRNKTDYKKTGKLGHNIYVGKVRSFTLRNSYVHHASFGHNVKSRAGVNRILYNRLIDGHDGNSSYLIDLPNGGTAYVIGNVMQQSRFTDNWTMINFASRHKSSKDRLYVINNTLVNERSSGVFIKNRGPGKALLINNIFAGAGKPLIGNGKLDGNLAMDRPGLRNRKTFDYRLVENSPAIDMGSQLKSIGDQNLIPEFEYSHPLKLAPRKRIGKLDIGAHEFGG